MQNEKQILNIMLNWLLHRLAPQEIRKKNLIQDKTESVIPKNGAPMLKLTHKKKVEDWIKTMKISNTPLCIIWHKLNDKLSEISEADDSDIELMSTYHEATSKIQDILVDRNLKGIEYEKNGATANAIRLYEANVNDLFDGCHPYERLRIIYTSEKKYSDAIRVCNAFIANDMANNPTLKEQYIHVIKDLSEKIK